ncbi:hypothetical protein Tco_0462355 [Tanacetum coccineum]
MSFGAILKDFSRDDLIELYRLVIKKYGANRPEEMYDRVLWGDLKTMFDPPLSDDAIWNRKYPLSKDACQVMLKMKLLDGTMDEVCYQLLKMIEKQAGIRKGIGFLLKTRLGIVLGSVSKRHADSDLRDNFPTNYRESDAARLSAVLKRTVEPLKVGEPLPELSFRQKGLEVSNSDVVAAREKIELKNLAKAQAKRDREGVGEMIKKNKRVRKDLEPQGSGSVGTHLSATPSDSVALVMSLEALNDVNEVCAIEAPPRVEQVTMAEAARTATVGSLCRASVTEGAGKKISSFHKEVAAGFLPAHDVLPSPGENAHRGLSDVYPSHSALPIQSDAEDSGDGDVKYKFFPELRGYRDMREVPPHVGDIHSSCTIYGERAASQYERDGDRNGMNGGRNRLGTIYGKRDELFLRERVSVSQGTQLAAV